MAGSRMMLSPELQGMLEGIRAKYNLPGLAAARLRDAEPMVSGVCGVRKWGDPNRTPIGINDYFHFGSCTKAMTATVLAILIEKSTLTWDTPLDVIFPELRTTMNPAFCKVRIEQLTAHMSGICGDCVGYQGGALWNKLWQPNLHPMQGRWMVVVDILTGKPSSTPGTKYEYSNYNYMIVGAILEKFWGGPNRRSWEQIITEELFHPLGMRSCGFGVQTSATAAIPNQPWPHSLEGGKENRPKHFDNPPTLGPAGTAYGTLEDWMRFAVYHLNGFRGVPDPYRLLQPASFKKLHQAYPGQGYTCGGWNIAHRDWAQGPVLNHSGSNTVNYCVIWIAPALNRIYMSATNIGGDHASKALDEAISKMIQLDSSMCSVM